MKTNILSKVLFALFFLSTSFLYSQNEYNVSVNNGMLVFANTSNYYHVIQDLSEEKSKDFINFVKNNMTFNALSSKPESILFLESNDDFIEHLINEDGFIQIGNYIYKGDAQNKICGVILAREFTPIIKAEMQADNYSNPLIRVYSAEDEVIGMVESNTPPSNARSFCGQGGVGPDKKDNIMNLSTPLGFGNPAPSPCGTLYCKISYIKTLGVYFALHARAENKCPERTVYIHKTPVAYIVKCGYTYGPVYQWDIPSGINGAASSGVWSTNYYKNVQPLNAYWFRIVFMAKDKDFINNPDNPSFDFEIRQNM